jgi:hypothetical protein
MDGTEPDQPICRPSPAQMVAGSLRKDRLSFASPAHVAMRITSSLSRSWEGSADLASRVG